MVEQPAVNRRVAGSSPASGANIASRWRTTTAPDKRASKLPKNGRNWPTVRRTVRRNSPERRARHVSDGVFHVSVHEGHGKRTSFLNCLFHEIQPFFALKAESSSNMGRFAWPGALNSNVSALSRISPVRVGERILRKSSRIFRVSSTTRMRRSFPMSILLITHRHSVDKAVPV